MTAYSPTPNAFGCLAYFPGTSSLVLFDTASFPAYTLNTCNTFQFVSGNWQLTNFGIPNNPSARTASGMAYDGTNLVLFGGKGPPGTNLMNDTWEYSSSSVWTNPIPNYNSNGLVVGSTPGLTIRKSPYMAALTSSIVLFGGAGTYFDNQDTWIWSGGSWTQQFPTTSPPERTGACFTSNGTTTAVLFAGGQGNQLLNDCWIWNTSAWTQLTTNTPPCCRKGAVMAWYPTGSYYLLFGGSDSSGNLLNDTWSLSISGTTGTWTKLNPTANISVRQGSVMAYDVASSQMILFGGLNSAQLLNDTQSWTGSTWVKL
jgi:hypothetical protein